jgi:hypothetical protein
MFFTRKYNDLEGLKAILNGTPVASGSAGSTTTAQDDLQDLTPGAFADVEVGDRIYISGETAVFLVDTKTNDNNLVLDANTTNTGSNLAWRAAKDNAIDLADVKFGGPISVGGGDGGFFVLELTTFG